MIRTVLFMVFLGGWLQLQSQEETKKFTDTVDIVDILESAIKGDGKYLVFDGFRGVIDTFYGAKESVILSPYEYWDSVQVADVCRRLEEGDNSVWRDAYKEIGNDVYNRLKLRFGETDGNFQIKEKVAFKKCRFIQTSCQPCDGLLYTREEELIINHIDFSEISVTNNTSTEKRPCGIKFTDCQFGPTGDFWWGNEVDMYFTNCTFTTPLGLGASGDIRFSNSRIAGFLEIADAKEVELNNCLFHSAHADTIKFHKEDSTVALRGSSLYFITPVHLSKIDSAKWKYLVDVNRISSRVLNVKASEDGGSKFKMNDCRIEKSTFEKRILLDGKFDVLVIEENDLNASIDLQKSQIRDLLSLDGNSNLTGLSIESVLFSEFKNYVGWADVSGEKLKVKNPFDGYAWWEHLYALENGENPDFVKNRKLYDKLIEMYKYLYDNYKSQGKTESFNGAYAEMKQVETRRWKYLFEQDKRFETFFRWKLNQFLNFFTDYGTNPAKAVIKSIWVILIFAIFYLFFPSDWDVSNRSEMLGRWKDLFASKREKSLLSTFLFLLYTGFIHLLNAVTLSLNAFTTLGFGDIPTHGAARYVTIVQGFIGWFLLTIFSVSLINQVLG